MNFRNEGIFEVTITDAFMAEAKFPPKEGELNAQGVPVDTYGDLCIQIQGANGETDLWRGEISAASPSTVSPM